MTPDESPPTHEKPESPPLLETLAAEKAGALTPVDTVETAGNRMRKLDTDTMPVAEDGKLVGVIDEKNPDWKIAKYGHDPKSWKVGAIMSRDIIFCHEEEDCDAALRVMAEHDLEYLPVVDRQMRIVGVFSRQELTERAARLEEAS